MNQRRKNAYIRITHPAALSNAMQQEAGAVKTESVKIIKRSETGTLILIAGAGILVEYGYVI